MATITIGNAALLNSITISDQIYVSAETGADFVFTDPVSGLVQDYSGVGFTYQDDGRPNGGTITGLDNSVNGVMGSHFEGLNVSMVQFLDLTQTGHGADATNLLTAADDQVFGSAFAESLRAGAGNDTVIALDGNDTVFGGDGADDVNGNKGDDIVHGDAGNDTVRGGQGADTVFGDDGDDGHVNGNFGDDSVSGGNGNDTVFGGQGNDTLHGDAGADLLSGDLGNDILYGDAGADRFTIASGGGLDWVADFKPGEGDRILLAPGTAYTVTSISGQVVIDLGGGAELGLAGVTAGTFSSDWVIFG